MYDDLDLRVIERDHDADPRYREALRQRVAAILDGSEALPIDDSAEAVMIGLVARPVVRPDRHRRRWMVSAAALLGAAAVIIALVLVPSRDDRLAPADQSVLATDPSMDETVLATDPSVDQSVLATDPSVDESVLATDPSVDGSVLATDPTATPSETPELFAEIAPGAMVELPGGPISASGDSATVWTGTEMIVWGGLPDGRRAEVAAFNLANGTWRIIAPAPISPRRIPAAVWTGTEMILWGGFIADDSRVYDGAAYNPATDTWRLLPPIPFSIGGGINILSMVWTGDEAVVVGGATAAAYDPVTNSWSRLADPPVPGYPAMRAGDSIVLMDSNQMMRYDLATDRWSVVNLGSSAELVGIQGTDGLVSTFVNLPSATGAPTQLLDGTGNPIAELPAFPGDPSLFGDRVGASGLWVGDEAIFWIWTGEFPFETEQVWALNPSTQTWRQLDAALTNHDALVVAGDVLLVWAATGDGGTGGFAYRAPTPPSG
ncbi:MAG: hypothetical protein ABIW84_01075 [Ilumatobacteraceae bacterium]